MATGSADPCQAGGGEHADEAGTGGVPKRRGKRPNASLFVLADRAKLLIVFDAFRGTTRFVDFKRRLQLSDATLAGRLRELVAAGVLRESRYSTRPPRSEYLLTECGRELWRIGVAIWTCQVDWRTVDVEWALVHDTCGQRITPAFGCASCGRYAFPLSELAPHWFRPMETFRARRRPPLVPYRRGSLRGTEATAGWGDLGDVLGDRWSWAVVGCAMCGDTRFTDFQRLLQIAPTQLTQRLNALSANGVLRRGRPDRGSPHAPYTITSKGLALVPILATNQAWTQRWFRVVDAPPVVACHSCGAFLDPDWWCDQCDSRLRWETLRVVDV